MRIQVQDFQSLGAVDIEANGLTVITGPSNIGKTALIRAIQGAVFGKPGDHYIRAGQTHSLVRLEFDDAQIAWQKTNKPTTTRQTALEVNGVLHTKLGRDQHKLTEPLGFRTIEAGGERFRPQVAMQHDRPFLLMENDTVIAEVMKQVSSADRVGKATDLARKERRSTDSLAKTRRGDLTEAKEALRELDGLADILEKHTLLTKQYDDTQARRQTNEGLIRDLERLKTLEPQPIPPVPPEVQTPQKLGALQDLKRFLEIKDPLQIPEAPPEVKVPQQLTSIQGLQRLKEIDRVSKDQLEQDEIMRGEDVALQTRKKELEEELGTCPTCERTFAEHDA